MLVVVPLRFLITNLPVVRDLDARPADPAPKTAESILNARSRAAGQADLRLNGRAEQAGCVQAGFSKAALKATGGHGNSVKSETENGAT
jgi:hypothetical protein